ncbi:MAG: hypothetical protein HYV34_02650 [Candidatus Kerfeldbacteria bacterium]|nr:hypothetical protein [Candidatus Kerfeldbacteria bacterium]
MIHALSGRVVARTRLHPSGWEVEWLEVVKKMEETKTDSEEIREWRRKAYEGFPEDQEDTLNQPLPMSVNQGKAAETEEARHAD